MVIWQLRPYLVACLLAALCLALPVRSDESILVLEDAPEEYLELGEVSANSKQYGGRTDAGKRGYVIRELQRQAAALGGNAVLVTSMKRLEQVEPKYGQRRGYMEYVKISLFVGNGVAIRIPDVESRDEPPK